MGRTSIEWCTWSANPIRASLGAGRGHYCEKVSPGCKHCYSSALQKRFNMPEFAEQRRSDVRHEFDDRPVLEILRRRKPERVFWCDMSDLFGDWVPDEWIDRCFAAMAASKQHTHLVLTKRPERMRDYLKRIARDIEPITRASHDHLGCTFASLTWPILNIWLGVSMEDQQRYDDRVDIATEIAWIGHPLSVFNPRVFLSLEPLLGPIDLGGVFPDYISEDGCRPAISWVIVGGESGSKARECDVAWIRSLRDQCAVSRTPIFIKQLGTRAYRVEDQVEKLRGAKRPMGLRQSKGGDWSEWPLDLRVREMP